MNNPWRKMSAFVWLAAPTLAAVLGACLALGAAVAAEQPQKTIATPTEKFWVEQLTDGFNSPYSMTWLPNGDMLIVEKFGGIRLFHQGKLSPALAGVPKSYQSAGSGLLDIALDPDFAKTRAVYLSYIEGDDDANRLAVYRARFAGDGFVGGKTIFRAVPDKQHPYPTGGRLLFLPDKTLLLTSGDNDAHRNLVQRMDNDIGKTLRINRNGSSPEDNPFLGTPGARPEIWTTGHRDSLGLFRDPRDGTIWETENGPKGGDELNILKPGLNYGWPLVTYGIDYNGQPVATKQEAPGLESPVTYWDPDIAPSGLTLYLGNKYPHWKGDLFVGGLVTKDLRRVRIRDGKAVEQEILLADLSERIRDVRVGPDGLLYVLTDTSNGRLLRLRPGDPKQADPARVAQPLKLTPAILADARLRLVGAEVKKFGAGDPAKGKTLFEQNCLACHTITLGEPAHQGPNLVGVLGRKAGSAAGFQYSQAMRDAPIFWSPGELEYFLAAPQAYVPGTQMTFQGIADVESRRDVIAYLRQAAK